MGLIDGLNFIIASLALYFSWRQEKNSNRDKKYDDVFGTALIKDLPIYMSKYTKLRSLENFSNLTDVLLEITESSLFYKYVDAKIFETISENTSTIEDCVTWCQLNLDEDSEKRLEKANECLGVILKSVYKK